MIQIRPESVIFYPFSFQIGHAGIFKLSLCRVIHYFTIKSWTLLDNTTQLFQWYFNLLAHSMANGIIAQFIGYINTYTRSIVTLARFALTKNNSRTLNCGLSIYMSENNVWFLLPGFTCASIKESFFYIKLIERCTYRGITVSHVAKVSRSLQAAARKNVASHFIFCADDINACLVSIESRGTLLIL